jgi:hypothetical protein
VSASQARIEREGLLQEIRQAVEEARFPQLRLQVRPHTARDLVGVVEVVVLHWSAQRKALPPGQPYRVFA